MKSILFTILIVIVFINCVHSQNQVSIRPIIGVYIYNSDNASKVMGEKNFLIQYGFGFNYESENVLDYNLQIEYSFLFSKRDNTLEFVKGGPEPTGYFYTDVSLYNHNLDFSLKDDLLEWLSIGIGPTLSVVNRSVEIEGFEDRLASFCLGINGLLQIVIPFSDISKDWFFTGSAKIRYLHGIWYDKKGRNLDDYSQNYLTSNFSIGLGYDF